MEAQQETHEKAEGDKRDREGIWANLSEQRDVTEAPRGPLKLRDPLREALQVDHKQSREDRWM